MFFSVIVPVYNVEKYVKQCIESVLNQDEQDFELILVDDGSTDNSGTICDEYASIYSDKIRVIHKSNEGLLITRRRGLSVARGDWMVHLDSDDYMLPGSLKSIREMAEKHDADLVLTKIVYGNEDESDLSNLTQVPFVNGEMFDGSNNHKLKMQFLYGGQMTAIYQKIAKREIVDIDKDYSSYAAVGTMEDHLQSLPILTNAKRPVFLDQPIIYYRWNGDSMTRKKSFVSYAKMYHSSRIVYEAEKTFREKWDISEIEEKKICAKHLRTLCNRYREAFALGSIKEVHELVNEMANDSFLKEEYKKADRLILGKKTAFTYKLVFMKQVRLLRLLYH